MLQDAIVNPVVPVSDIERAKAFCAEKLELQPQFSCDGHVAYRCGDHFFHLTTSMGAGTSQATVLQFFGSDLDAAMADLRSRGVAFEDYDCLEFTTVDGVYAEPGWRVSWFRDSEGNIISLAQPDGEARDRVLALTR